MIPASQRLALGQSEERLMQVTEYAPNWVPLGVALALGFGTMIGWKRIVVTVGEKIGKAHHAGSSQIRHLNGCRPRQATLQPIHDRLEIFPETLSPSFSLHPRKAHSRISDIRHEYP